MQKNYFHFIEKVNSTSFLLGNGLLKKKQQVDMKNKNSNFDNFESAFCMESMSIPLTNQNKQTNKHTYIQINSKQNLSTLEDEGKGCESTSIEFRSNHARNGPVNNH